MNPLELTEVDHLKSLVGTRGELIFAQRAGSWAFNFNTPTSDIDYFGIFIASDPLTNTCQTINHTVKGNDGNDWTLYEFSRYVELLVKGNPKVIEPLFATNFCYVTEKWQKIRDFLVLHVLTKVVVEQYLGFASFELHGAKNAIKNAVEASIKDFCKPIYHSLRLVRESKLITAGKHPRVYWQGDEREELMKIRLGETSQSVQQLVELSTREIDEVRADLSKSPIPDSADTSTIGEWLVNQRLSSLRELAKAQGLKKSVDALQSVNPPSWVSKIRERSLSVLQKHSVELECIMCISPIGSTALGLLTGQTHISPTQPPLSTDSPDEEQDFLVIYQCKTTDVLNPFKSMPVFLHEYPSEKYGRGLTLCELGIVVSTIARHHQLYEALVAFPNDSRASAEWTWMHPVYHAFSTALKSVSDSPAFATVGLVSHYLGLSSGLLKATAIWPNPTTDSSSVAPCEIDTDVLKKQQKSIYLAQRFIFQAENLLEAKRLGGAPAFLTNPQSATLGTIKHDEILTKEALETHRQQLLSKISDIQGIQKQQKLDTEPSKATMSQLKEALRLRRLDCVCD